MKQDKPKKLNQNPHNTFIQYSNLLPILAKKCKALHITKSDHYLCPRNLFAFVSLFHLTILLKNRERPHPKYWNSYKYTSIITVGVIPCDLATIIKLPTFCVWKSRLSTGLLPFSLWGALRMWFQWAKPRTFQQHYKNHCAKDIEKHAANCNDGRFNFFHGLGCYTKTQYNKFDSMDVIKLWLGLNYYPVDCERQWQFIQTRFIKYVFVFIWRKVFIFLN